MAHDLGRFGRLGAANHIKVGAASAAAKANHKARV
jgi:hypothetical protein